MVRIAGPALDFLVLHLYYPAASQARVSFTSPTWLTATMAAAQQTVANIEQLRVVIAAISPRAAQIELVVTEYGILPIGPHEPRYSSTLANGLYYGDLLMTLLQHPEFNITLATAWTLIDGSTQEAAIHYDWSTGSRWARPHYYALQLLRHSLAPNLRRTSVTSPTFGTAQVGNVSYTLSIPMLGALASTDGGTADGARAQPRGDRADPLHLHGYTPQPTATVRTLTGASLAAHNEDVHMAVTPATSTLSLAAPTLTYTFPAHSLTLLELQGSSVPTLA